MNQRSLFILFSSVFILSFFYFIRFIPYMAHTVFVNGTVYTLDLEKPVVEAVAVNAARIVGTGTSHELLEKYKAKQVIDLTGKTMVPGLTDAHAHMNGLGEWMQSINI